MNPPSLRSRDFQRILLIKPSAIGDVIHTLPLLAKLRARYPQAQIDWLLTPAIAELLQHHPALSGILLFARQEWSRPWRLGRAVSQLWDLVRELRQRRYELVLDLHGQFRSALFTLLTGAPVRIGFDRPRSCVRWQSRVLPPAAYRHGWTGAREGAWLAYTHHIPIPTLDVHAVDRYLWLGPLLGLDSGPPEFQVPVPAAAETQVAALLRRHALGRRPLAVLVPGTTWETKRWLPAGFAAVARHLLHTDREVVLAGSAAEWSLCQQVAQESGAINLAGQTTLSQLAALLRRAAVCVTNDSGSMHLTVALGRPVVSIFGPTDPLWIGPYRQPQAVLQARLPCLPCYLRKLRQCPHHHACMQAVTPAEVIARLEQVLAAQAAA